MMPQIWLRSFAEIVASGHMLWRRGLFFESGCEYWQAAFVAPTADQEATVLEWCWVALERAQGRTSELEKAA